MSFTLSSYMALSITTVALPLSAGIITILRSSRRFLKAAHCLCERLDLGGLAECKTLLTPALSCSAMAGSSQWAVASMAAMMSDVGILLGAMEKFIPRGAHPLRSKSR